MEQVFPIFGSIPDKYGNAIAVPIRYCNRKDYFNELGIDPLTIKVAIANSRWIRK